VTQRGFDPLVAFPDGHVGQAHHEKLNADVDADFNRYGDSMNSDQGTSECFY
jgi:hypothetical protein